MMTQTALRRLGPLDGSLGTFPLWLCRALVAAVLVPVVLWPVAALGAFGSLGQDVAQNALEMQVALVPIAVLGWLAVRSRAARVPAALMLVMLALALLGFMVYLASVNQVEGPGPGGAQSWAGWPSFSPPRCLLWRPLRVVLARWLPLEPDTFRHWLGLAAVLWFTVLPFALIPLLGDRPPFEALYDQMGIGVPQGYDWAGDLRDLGWMIALSLVAVGFPLARTLSGARLRLGLTWPGWRVLALAVLLSLLMVPVMMAIDSLMTAAVAALGLPTASDGWTDRLFGTGHSLGAVLLFGLTAGVGEELIWRGVLQPRYGLILTTLSFAAVHAFQYGAGALVSVFIAGLALGLVRQRTNTTTSIVVHASYDIWLIAGRGEGALQLVTWLVKALGGA